MSGWRAKLGVIVPSSNTTTEPEFAAALPNGVSLHAARMRVVEGTVEDISRMATDGKRCGDLVATADVDCLVYASTTGSLLEGPGYDAEIIRQLRESTGTPTVATAKAIKAAFRALDLESIVIATPYIDDLNEREREFLEAAGFDVRRIEGLGITRNTEIGSLTTADAYREAVRIDVDDADGVYVSCTNWATFDVVEALERDLEKPVVTSNQATLWQALDVAGVDTSEIEVGSLFEHTP